jgi:Ca2+-binding EF-hand superfamily protein
MLDALATALLIGAAGQLESPEQTRQPLFTRLDRNGDGYVSLLEARHAGMTELDFSELDRNDDGRLTAQELRPVDDGRLLRGRPGRPSGWPQY